MDRTDLSAHLIDLAAHLIDLAAHLTRREYLSDL
jgi:hypothetical protein